MSTNTEELYDRIILTKLRLLETADAGGPLSQRRELLNGISGTDQ